LLALALLVFFGCRKDRISTDSSAKINFSIDTLTFDTVFTTIGSTTKSFKVYNPNKEIIEISSISLGKGNGSFFKLNINGVSSTRVKDVELYPGDSLFVFVQVNINPNNSNNPMVVQDSIIFSYNGNNVDIDLIAYGQDVLLIDGQYVYDTIWTNEKPVLVYNSMAVDSFCTLTIEAGTKVHFHKNSYLYVFPTGSLKVFGTLEEPVIFEGDRLEDIYENVPGQWGGIHLTANSTDNIIDYAEVRNAVIGIRVDSFNIASSNPTLTISNTIIKNMNYAGLLGAGSVVSATNMLIHNCGYYAVALLYGGSYEFYHCTIGNYWANGNRITPSVILNNYFISGGTAYVRNLLSANFVNCIIHGSEYDELALDAFPGAGDFNYLFDHCLLKYSGDVSGIGFSEIILNQMPKFIDTSDENYELDTLSPAINAGIISLPANALNDFLGISRTSYGAPDLGAFERIE
ncbi:MAG: hypothetical protein JXR58_05300, partial [Bacteroidales bacterium]|nr:hypothetical protein [Bacteroidales bacterium]